MNSDEKTSYKRDWKDAMNFLKRTSSNQKNGKYLTNSEIRKELEKSHEEGKPTERLHMMFFLISMKLSNHRNFYYYQNKYGMIKIAYMGAVKYWDKFNLEYRNEETGQLASPFSYFTQVIKFKFIEEINKLNKRKKQLDRLRVDENNQFYSLDDTDLELEIRKNEKNNLNNFNKNNKGY